MHEPRRLGKQFAKSARNKRLMGLENFAASNQIWYVEHVFGLLKNNSRAHQEGQQANDSGECKNITYNSRCSANLQLSNNIRGKNPNSATFNAFNSKSASFE